MRQYSKVMKSLDGSVISNM